MTIAQQGKNIKSSQIAVLSRSSERLNFSAETIPTPEESQFRFLDLFGHFAGIGTGIGAKMNQKRIVFPIHNSSIQREAKGIMNHDSFCLSLK